jgi:hypothetical protein
MLVIKMDSTISKNNKKYIYSLYKNKLAKVPNEASCAWEPNLINFPILGKKMVKIEKLGNQKA